MKYNKKETLGQYLNKFPFNKSSIHTVNIFMESDNTLLLSVTVPRYIWHMNVFDAINDMDKNYYSFKINTFDQKVVKTSMTKKEGDNYRTLDIYIEDYYDTPMLISS